MDNQPGDSDKKPGTVIEGIPASPGIIIGPCYLYLEPLEQPEPVKIPRGKVSGQIRRFRHAVDNVHTNLQKSYEKTLDQFGKELAEIVEMQLAFLEDKIFLKEVEEAIKKNRYEAAYATYAIFGKKKDYFLKMSNEYFRDRAFDIQSLREMIIQDIRGKSFVISIDKPSIVIADNLSPTDTVQLHEQQVLGFATNAGGKNSHTAIVARSLGVPAVVGLRNITEEVNSGDTLILDGNNGKVIVNPLPETISVYEEQQRIFSHLEKTLLKETALETKTRDGKQISLHANIEFENELPRVFQVGAAGIGLFRTEGLFLNRYDMPPEEEQAEIYSRIAEKMYPRNLVIRTLDIGGDKVFPGILSTKEDNPFLGWRAIRFWLDHKIGFIAQLKAILRANVKGNVKIMLPMVSGLGELCQVKDLINEAKDTLRKEGKDFGESIQLGIMIEIPSVVLLADVLTKEVDFFSIGTNDLVQYTLAVDRGNAKVAKLYSHFHPAVLRMISMTIEAGRKANIPVCMCGEMAGDPLAVPVLLAMGLEHFSATPAVIPEIKKIIRDLSLAECRELYQQVENIYLTNQIIETVKEFFRQKFPEMYRGQ